MRPAKNRALAATTALAVAASLALTSGASYASSSGKSQGAARGPAAWTIRSIDTNEFGVDRPSGLSWDARSGALVVAGAPRAGRTKVVRVTPGERFQGRTLMRSVRPAARVGLSGAGGVTTPDGARHVLDAKARAIVTVGKNGRMTRVALKGLAGHTVRGLAWNPADRRLYVADTTTRTLRALDAAGRTVRTQSLARVHVANLRGMTFAPSADPTDAPATQSLYLADAGTRSTLGRVAEVSLAAPTAFAVTAVGTPTVVTRDTSIWSPPSPDPSGVTYIPGSDRLLVSDGEVDEMPIYAGANLYTATRDGGLTGTGTTLSPVAYTNEPTGVAYNVNNGHLFISDDDKKSVFEIAGPGADNQFGTADDGARTTFKASTFGNTDTEDVGYDPTHDELLLIDGVGREFFRLAPGPNGRFDGVAPGGDDIVSNFDLEHLGVVDPEGITYDTVRDTVVVVDGSAIWEVSRDGSLINTIPLSGLGTTKPAGITIAPASDGSGGRSYYVVDRGLDNNSHPGENDGQIHEISAALSDITNQPPAASAGADQLLDLGQTAQLQGSGTDDGVPGPLGYTWSMVSGPGTVTFGNANAAATTATFSTTGQYVLRLTVSDGELSDSDDMVVDVYQPGGVRTVSLPVVSGSDDAIEGGGTSGKFVDVASADNELGDSGTGFSVLTGLRFAGIPIPAGGEVVSARIQFKVDELGSAPASYTIRGEAADNASTYLSVGGNISARPSTTSTVPWAPPAWGLIGEAGPNQLTPELKTVLQEIVNRPGWAQNNAAAFMISGTGRRTAEAKDGLSAPVLVLQFRTVPPPVNTPPVVNAGADSAVQRPTAATLSGTVTDDGLPGPVSSTWSTVSGPGTVTFANPAAPATTATFSAAGVYTLRLSATDGALSAQDDVVVTVTDAPPADTAPVMNAGADQAVTLPSTASLSGAVTSAGATGPVTTAWSKVSGPGSVTFTDPAALSTTATFSAAGSYTLRLTGTNAAALSGSDDVVVTVAPAPDLSVAVTLKASPASVSAGDLVTLRGKVTRSATGAAVPGASVDVMVTRLPGGTSKLGTVTTAADGSFSITDRPTVRSEYVATSGGATSPKTKVNVKTKLTATLTKSQVTVGARAFVRGQVSPTVAGQRLRLQRFVKGSWRTVQATGLPGADRARYRFAVRPGARGAYRYRVVVAATVGRDRAIAPGTIRGLTLRAYWVLPPRV